MRKKYNESSFAAVIYWEINMKINFTKKEFVTLLEMIDIANWVKKRSHK